MIVASLKKDLLISTELGVLKKLFYDHSTFKLKRGYLIYKTHISLLETLVATMNGRGLKKSLENAHIRLVMNKSTNDHATIILKEVELYRERDCTALGELH
jgi:hypothetical protein